MPEFIVIIREKGDPQPHCAIPVNADSAHEIVRRIEIGVPPLVLTKSITAFASPRDQTAATWKERLATLGTHHGAIKEFCERYGCTGSNVQYWLKRFPRPERDA